MKNTIFFILIILVYHANAQVSKIITYNYSVGTTKINATDWKYFLMDVPASQCRIYNLDHSLYKTISCPVPSNNYLYDIKLVSENLFNNDSKIELFYSYYEWITSGGPGGTGYYKYGAKIINESGTILQDITGGLYAYLFRIADNQSQLFVYCYDNSVSPYKIWTNIYNVGGDASAINIFQNNQLKSALTDSLAYPNPSSNIITIPYSLPETSLMGIIKIYDINGIMIKSFEVDKTFNSLLLDVSEYTSGLYIYTIETNGFIIKKEKFEIQ